MGNVYRLVFALLIIVTLVTACAGPAQPAAAPAPAAQPAAEKPAEPPAAAAKAPEAQPAGDAQGEGQVIETLGRPYLAYPKTKGEIRFLNCWGGARVPLIEKWIKDFNAIYPDIKVINDTTDCSKILQTTVTQVAGGDAPNVVMVQSNNFPFLAKDNTLMPLNDLVERDKIDPSWWYDAEWNARTHNGKLYGMPNVVAGAMHLIYSNSGLLEKIGWDPKKPIETWQDMEAMAAKAKEAGLFVMDPAKLSTGMTALGVLIYANGGQYWTDDLKTATLNSKEAVEAAEWELKFVKEQADKYENLAAAGNRKDVIQAPTFGAEKYINAINGSWFAFQLNQQAPNVKYAISLFPKNASNPKSTGQTFIEGGWAFAIPNIAKNKEAAWEWIKFITASKYECDFIAAQVRPSPVKRCNEDPRLANSTPYWNTIQNALSYAKQVPLTDIHPKFQEILFEAEDNILYEKMTPKEAMDQAQAKAQALLDEWNKTRK